MKWLSETDLNVTLEHKTWNKKTVKLLNQSVLFWTQQLLLLKAGIKFTAVGNL